jgi:hypothetical protein
MALPEKDFFTLDEIATRWGCDHSAFLSYASRDILTYAVYLRDLGSHRSVEETNEQRITRTHTVAFAMSSPSHQNHSLHFLRSDDARRVLESGPHEQVAISVLYKSPQRTKENGIGYMQAKYFTRSDLVVCREERNRFETTHNIIGKVGWLARGWNWLRDPENQKPLAILGGGIAAIAAAVWTALQWLLRVTPPP